MRGLLLDVADTLIGGLQGRHRWRLFSLLGEFIETDPDRLWAIVERWGCARSRDLRSAVGVYILEHLLEHHFGRTFPQVRRLLESNQRRFAFTVRCCYRLGQAAQPRNRKALDTLLRRFPSPEWERYGKLTPKQKEKWLEWNRRMLEILKEIEPVLDRLGREAGLKKGTPRPRTADRAEQLAPKKRGF